MREPSLAYKISLAKKILKNDFGTQFTKFFKQMDTDEQDNVYKFYAATNENLHYFRGLTSFKDKDVVVPTGSGDHALNAIFFGARSVETFDINSIAKYHYDLKETAVKYLSYEEFLEFYTDDFIFDKLLYNKLRDHLQEETRIFFDAIYDEIGERQTYREINSETGRAAFIGSLIEEYTTYGFIGRISAILKRNNPYLENEQNYLALRKKLFELKKPVTHKVCSMHELEENFDKKDIIILSNILTCYYRYSSDKNEFIKYGIKPLLKYRKTLLKRNGIISADYIYDDQFLEEISPHLKQEKIKITQVESKENADWKDSVIVINK